MNSPGNWVETNHHALVGDVIDCEFFFLPPFMYDRGPSPPPPHSPSRSLLRFPHILLFVRMNELLTALISLLFFLFLVFIYLPLVLLYYSRFRFGTDTLSLMNLELPPAKRRKGLAGSIVSTALSAALIGTAVGLTVYRL